MHHLSQPRDDRPAAADTRGMGRHRRSDDHLRHARAARRARAYSRVSREAPRPVTRRPRPAGLLSPRAEECDRADASRSTPAVRIRLVDTLLVPWGASWWAGERLTGMMATTVLSCLCTTPVI